ncbi:MAG: DUF134 domain-containing protein [Lachnospiraceae bacterium]|nr:DUF134 domain-containing protein [Lachnospiraceae bacterium]
MPRPQRNRRICREPLYREFAPLRTITEKPLADKAAESVKDTDLKVVTLSLDEYEAIRMVDYIGLTHEQCAAHMRVSRTTVTEVYERARKKIADAIVNGKKLLIEGGNYSVCENASKNCMCGMLAKNTKSTCKE